MSYGQVPPSSGGQSPPPADSGGPSGGYAGPPSGGYVNPPASGYTGPPSGGYTTGTPTNLVAVFGLISGILAVLTLCALVGPVSMLLGVVPLVLGYISRNQIRQTGASGEGMATAALGLGIAAIALGLLETIGCAGLFAGVLGAVSQGASPR